MSDIVDSQGYSQEWAARLVPLTTLANNTLSNLMLPDQWALLYQYSASSTYGGSQYFLAADLEADPVVCVLVLGAQWPSFISFYVPFVNHVMRIVDTKIVGVNPKDTDPKICADTGFCTMYSALRTRLWHDIASIQQTMPAFSASLSLITVGIGPGAALAQLAAIDLRPGKEVEPSTVTHLQSYVYSCPPFGDDNFAHLFANNIAAGFRVLAPADFFPTQPTVESGYIPAGQPQDLPLKIPTYDSPWVERDGPYYQQLLTGQDIVVDGDGSVDAASFDLALASSMAKLCAVAYQMSQHPGTLFSCAPYTWMNNVIFEGSVWASVFESPDTLVIALRGTCSWEELFTLVSDAFPGMPTWLPEDYGQYAKPLVDLYQAGRDLLRDALNSLGNKPVILTGHDCGGALANLMAVDIVANPLQGNRTVSAVYTFGVQPAASPVFANSFATGPLRPINFQVIRPRDVMPKLRLQGFFVTFGNQVRLEGGDFDSYNGSTWHGLYNYITLLDTDL